jgi:osmotically-inducible protein OsmY
MNFSRKTGISAALLALALMVTAACSRSNQVSYKDNVERALQQADLKDVKVDEDKDKNTITLGGTVASEDAKQRAGNVAKEAAPSRVIANEVAIRPVGMESEARKISSNLDDAIEKDYKAQLVAAGLDKQDIDFAARNGVLTLKGSVHNMQQRQKAQQVAESVPHVEQVVNQIEIKR